MKVFLAINIPFAVKQKIEEQITPFKKDYPDMTWVPPENFHITLYNFDDMENTKRVEKIIEDAIFEIRPFTLFAMATDVFLSDKITLFMNFYREKMLDALITSIYERMNDSEKREVFPQIVVARYRIPSKQQYLLIKKKIQNLKIDIEFLVPKIYLYESITGGKKPVYKKLAEFTLLA